MTRAEAIANLVEGLVKMENGKADPFPIPSNALTLFHSVSKGAIVHNTDEYAKFVCAVILGKFDDQLKDWV